jgi:hypothetical protein
MHFEACRAGCDLLLPLLQMDVFCTLLLFLALHPARIRLAMQTCKSTRFQHAGHDPRWNVSIQRKRSQRSLKMSPDKSFLDIINKKFIEKPRWW